MKKIIYILIALPLLCSCQKEDKNGDLDGFWKLMQKEDVATGTVTNTKEQTLFWSIQLDLLQINKNYYGRFQNTGDSLFIQMIDDPGTELQQYGISKQHERFGIITLNRNSMVLKSDIIKLTFKKF